DEFIRIIPFINTDIAARPQTRQYKVRTASELTEPSFTARPVGTPWTPGLTQPWGEELEFVGARFKKLSILVRSDELMVDHGVDDMLTVQVELAEVGLVRALSESLFSAPPDDDDSELTGLL